MSRAGTLSVVTVLHIFMHVSSHHRREYIRSKRRHMDRLFLCVPDARDQVGLSCYYNVVSKWTSFIAVEEREEGEYDDPAALDLSLQVDLVVGMVCERVCRPMHSLYRDWQEHFTSTDTPSSHFVDSQI